MHWNFHAERPYFVLDPEGEGIVYFATAAERDAHAKTIIEGYLDTDGWSEAVEYIICGEVTHASTRCNIMQRPAVIDEDGIDEDGEYWDSDAAFKCNYEMLPIKKKE